GGASRPPRPAAGSGLHPHPGQANDPPRAGQAMGVSQSQTEHGWKNRTLRGRALQSVANRWGVRRASLVGGRGRSFSLAGGCSLEVDALKDSQGPRGAGRAAAWWPRPPATKPARLRPVVPAAGEVLPLAARVDRPLAGAVPPVAQVVPRAAGVARRVAPPPAGSAATRWCPAVS